MPKYTYSDDDVRTEVDPWVIEKCDVDGIAKAFCPKNSTLELSVPIGDHLCTEFTKTYEKPKRNPYKAKNQYVPAKFDTLPILLPRILGLTIGELNNRFSEQFYNQVLPDTYKAPKPKSRSDNRSERESSQNDYFFQDTQIESELTSQDEFSFQDDFSQDTQTESELTKIENAFELTGIRMALALYYSEKYDPYNNQEMSLLKYLNENTPQALKDGIIGSKAEALEEFNLQRETFWIMLRQVLSLLYSERFAEEFGADGALIADYIEQSDTIPTILPIKGYYKSLYPVIKSFAHGKHIPIGKKPVRKQPDEKIIVAPEVKEILAPFFYIA